MSKNLWNSQTYLLRWQEQDSFRQKFSWERIDEKLKKTSKNHWYYFHFLKIIYWFFTKTSQFETFAIAWNKCQIKKNSTVERAINDKFDCLFQQLKDTTTRRIHRLSKVFQLDESTSFLLENDDHSSNQRDRFQKRIERNCAFNRKNRVRLEAY